MPAEKLTEKEIQAIEEKKKSLRKIVKHLRRMVKAAIDSDAMLDKQDISDRIRQLAKLDSVFSKKYQKIVPVYQYDTDTYPVLARPRNGYHIPTLASKTKTRRPKSLAEALLWKQGHWPHYLDFIDWYRGAGQAKDSETIVNHAFAQHLKNNSNPIVDQHSMRALWATAYKSLWNDSGDNCRGYLISSKSWNWKKTPGGKKVATNACNLYRNTVQDLCGRDLDLQRNLDMLLMPLGQALKYYSQKKTGEGRNDYERFCVIVGLQDRPYHLTARRQQRIKKSKRS